MWHVRLRLKCESRHVPRGTSVARAASASCRGGNVTGSITAMTRATRLPRPVGKTATETLLAPMARYVLISNDKAG